MLMACHHISDSNVGWVNISSKSGLAQREDDSMMLGQHWANLRGHLNIKMSSHQYRDPHAKDKMVSWPSYL